MCYVVKATLCAIVLPARNILPPSGFVGIPPSSCTVDDNTCLPFRIACLACLTIYLLVLEIFHQMPPAIDIASIFLPVDRFLEDLYSF